MHEINKMASVVVWRGFGFCWLAIAAAMSGMIFDLSLACRVGAFLALVLALLMQLKAATYHRVRYIKETEVWIMLREEARPSQEIARRFIVPAMRDELHEKALYSAVMGSGLFLISLALGLLMS
jgi:hypothetical protein